MVESRMEKYHKISVITVVYNGAYLLEQTIKSVISQTYPTIEYIIIDGYSNDGTIAIIKKYEKNISFWTSEKDNGIYDAMNKGLKKATGDYVIFMNAGDMFYSNNTIEQIPFEKNQNADVFYGDTVIIDENTGKELGLRRKKLPKNLTWKHYKKGMVVCHQSILVKKSIAGNFNIRYQLSADVDWVIIVLKKSRKIIYTNTIISRFLGGGVSRKYQKRSLLERFIILRNHFGIIQTIFSHVFFLVEALTIKLGLKPLYRRNIFTSN